MAAQQRVELNVGGRIFVSNRSTFLEGENTYFHSLLCSGNWNPDLDGAYFIDRDPESFERIMKSLRSGSPVDFEGLTTAQAKLLEQEIDYYQIGTKEKLNLLKWDAQLCSPTLTFSKDGYTVSSPSDGWVCAQANSPDVTSFTVCLRELQEEAWVGYAKAGLVQHYEHGGRSVDSVHWGWFLANDGEFIVNDGELYSDGNDTSLSSTDVGFSEFFENDVVTVTFDKLAMSLWFEVNGIYCGTVHLDCEDGPLFPSVVLRGSSITIKD